MRGSRKDGTWTAQDKMGHRANVNLFFDVISIGGFPRMCHLNVPDPIGNMMGIHWDSHGNTKRRTNEVPRIPAGGIHRWRIFEQTKTRDGSKPTWGPKPTIYATFGRNSLSFAFICYLFRCSPAIRSFDPSPFLFQSLSP